MDKYELVTGSLSEGLNAFERRVNAKLNQGYTALGGPMVFQEHTGGGLGSIVQAVIKYPSSLYLDVSRISDADKMLLKTWSSEQGQLLHPGPGVPLPSTNIQERGDR